MTTLRTLSAAVTAVLIAAGLLYQQAFGNETEKNGTTPVSGIIQKLEDRYAGETFSAEFFQESVLSALDISDTAEGKAWFSHPGKMRWEYFSPDRHVIVTDGETLWIHRPDEYQVVKGDAERYFGGGKGAGFLANFEMITESFEVRLEEETDTRWRLRLIPLEDHHELSAVYLSVRREDRTIEQVTTKNVYEDTTIITFENPDFSPEADEDLFSFEIPEGTDVVYMDE